MYRLKNLNNPIKSLDGTQILDISGQKALTYKMALVQVAEMHRPSGPGSGEGIMAFNLGLKILNAKDSLDLSKEDLELLRKIVRENWVFISIVIGRLNEYLDSAEEIKEQS